MKSIWTIQAETNIQVGNENTSNVGFIDKTVQRDALTGIPCINASSLKGAMNEYATQELKLTPHERITMFGVDKENAKDTSKGKCTFFDAHLLLLPVQDDNRIYKLVTCEEQIRNFLSLAQMIGIDYQYNDFIEFLCAKYRGFFNNDQEHILSFNQFKTFCEDDELPIIARNCLIGEGNLWYEQILPHKTVFGTLFYTNDDVKKSLYKFDNNIIQIGANATIGYGFCRFTKIKEI